jgi:hypothetical protein
MDFLMVKVKKGKIGKDPCYRPWRPLGLREVEAPTFLRQTANIRRQGCQPYAPALPNVLRKSLIKYYKKDGRLFGTCH